MALPVPQDVQHQARNPGPGVAFTVLIDGRSWRCLVTNNALDALYGGHRDDDARVRRVKQHSYLTRLVAQEIQEGDTIDPIVITSAMVTSGKYASWRVTFVYDGGPLDGDREERSPSTINPETMQVVWSDTPGTDGRRWAYTISDRAINRENRTATITLSWGNV
jgi:hypothetical protein